MIQIMKNHQSRHYSMEQLYQMLGTSRQSVAQSNKRKLINSNTEDQLISSIKEWRKHHPKMGSRQMYYSLINHGTQIHIGINKFEQMVSRRGLGACPAKSFKPLTSDGKGKESYPNLTNGLIINDINQLIVGDITYFDIKGTWHYICTLKDVYSQYILSLVANNNMKTQNLIQAITECAQIRTSKALQHCIHHSDNGSQYNATAYKAKLKSLGMRISRAEGCQQNGSSEQLNHIIKNMYLNHWSIHSLKELRQACKELKYLNNHQRTISQLGNKTPYDFETHIQSVPIKQRTQKQMYDFTK